LVSRTPTSIAGRLVEHSTKPLALRGFAIGGLNRDAYLAGAKVVEMYSFAPTEGAAMCATLLTHQGTAYVAFDHDSAAIADGATMRRCPARGVRGTCLVLPQAR
jgi:hypothetical protein